MKQKLSSKQQNLVIEWLKEDLAKKGYEIKVLKNNYEIGHHTILIINSVFICCWWKIAIEEVDYVSGMMRVNIFDGGPIDSIVNFRATYDMIDGFSII